MSALQDQTSLDFPWREYISRTGATSTATFAYGSGTRATMQIDVNWADLTDPDEAVLEGLLGYPGITSGNLLSRHPPMQHPVWGNLWCSGVSSCVGVKWLGKSQENFGPFSAYNLARLGLVFEAPPYAVMDDSDLLTHYAGKEWYRWFTRETKPALSNIARDGTSLVYVDGPGGINGQPIKGTFNQLLKRQSVTCTWYHLPWPFVMNANDFPGRVDAAAGLLNLTGWYGYTAGTLMLKEYSTVYVPSPVPVLGIPLWNPQRLVNVIMQMGLFEPPLNPSYTANAGWNLGPAFDGYYYKLADERTGTVPPYGSAEYATIFTHV